MYVLKDKELRVEIIWLHYDVPVAGHGGKVEDNRASYKELLVARSDKKCGRM